MHPDRNSAAHEDGSRPASRQAEGKTASGGPRANHAAVVGAERVRGVLTLAVVQDQPVGLEVRLETVTAMLEQDDLEGHTVLFHPGTVEWLTSAVAVARRASERRHCVVSMFAPREWRSQLRPLAGPSALPLEDFDRVEQFAVLWPSSWGAVPMVQDWDLWVWADLSTAPSLQVAAYYLKRRLRKELHGQLSTRVKNEPFDGGSRGLDYRDVRRAATNFERQSRSPLAAPTTEDPRKLAAGDPNRGHFTSHDTLPLDFATHMMSDEELRHGRVRVAMERLRSRDGKDTKRVKSARRVLRLDNGTAWDAIFALTRPALLGGCGARLTRAEERSMQRTAFYRVPLLTARLIPCTTWHLEDHSADEHERRCLVTSHMALRKGACRIAAEAAARAVAACETRLLHLHLQRAALARGSSALIIDWLGSVTEDSAFMSDGEPQEPRPHVVPERGKRTALAVALAAAAGAGAARRAQERSLLCARLLQALAVGVKQLDTGRRPAAAYLQDAHDESPVAYAPMDVKEVERAHRMHCALCRRQPWSPTGRGGIPLPGGCHHHRHCYYAKVHEMLVFGLHCPFIGEDAGDPQSVPLPEAELPYHHAFYGRDVEANLEAVKAGLIKLGSVPYGVRLVREVQPEHVPAYDAAVAEMRADGLVQMPLWDVKHAIVPAGQSCLSHYDLPVPFFSGPDGTWQPRYHMTINVAFRNREIWRAKLEPTFTPKPRVTSGLHRNHNGWQRKPTFAYRGHDWLHETVTPGMRVGLDDISNFFPQIPLSRDRRQTQIYLDASDGRYKAVVGLGFGGVSNPFYASQISTEMSWGLRGEAALCEERFLLEQARLGVVGLPPPDLVLWRQEGGSVNSYVDDYATTGWAFSTIWGHSVDLAADAQDHLDELCGDARLNLAVEKRERPNSEFVYLGLEYNSSLVVERTDDAFGIAPRGFVLVAEVKLPDQRRQQLRQQLELIRGKNRATLHELRSLVGSMTWASFTMRGASAYIADTRVLMSYALRQRDLAQEAREPLRDSFNLSKQVQKEFKWWEEHLDPESGWPCSRFIDTTNVCVVLLRSDAAGEDGWGYFVVPECPTDPIHVISATGGWLPIELDWPSFTKELKPVIEAARRLAGHWKGRMVVWVTDNSGVAHALNAGRAFDPRARELLKELADLMIKYNFDIIGRYAWRGLNIAGDCLSRQQSMRQAWEEDCKVTGEDPSEVRRRRVKRDEKTARMGEVRVAELCCGVRGFGRGVELAQPEQDGDPSIRMAGAIDGCPTAVEVARFEADFTVKCRDLLAVEGDTLETRWLPRRDFQTDPPSCSRSAAFLVMSWRVLVILASPPCQPWSKAGKGVQEGDRRTDVVLAVVDIVLACGAACLVLENVQGFENSSQWERALNRLGPEWTASYALVECHKIGCPQARARVIIMATRIGQFSVEDYYEYERVERFGGAISVIADRLPSIDFLWHHPIGPTDRAVLDAKRRPARTLLTSCLKRPVKDVNGQYKMFRYAVDAPPQKLVGGEWVDAVHFLTPATAGQLMGFPADFPWTPEPRRCACPFCFRGRFARGRGGAWEVKFRPWEPTAAAKQIGNAVPLELGSFVGRMVLRLFAELTTPYRAERKQHVGSPFLGPTRPTAPHASDVPALVLPCCPPASG